jgi:predicted membrane channel-forming protein YqfA (hemolysin III family)
MKEEMLKKYQKEITENLSVYPTIENASAFIGFAKNTLNLKNQEIVFLFRGTKELFWLKFTKYISLFLMAVGFLMMICTAIIRPEESYGVLFVVGGGLLFLISWFFYIPFNDEVKDTEPFASELFNHFSTYEAIKHFQEKTPLIVGLNYLN